MSEIPTADAALKALDRPRPTNPNFPGSIEAWATVKDYLTVQIAQLTRELADQRDAADVQEQAFVALGQTLGYKQRRIAELENQRTLVSVHIGTSLLSRDLVWCQCGRGLSRNGKWGFCPKCGNPIDQESYRSACDQAVRNGRDVYSQFDADLVNKIGELEEQLGTVLRATEFVCSLCGSPAYWDNEPDQQVWRHVGCRKGSTEVVICDKYGYPIPVRAAMQDGGRP